MMNQPPTAPETGGETLDSLREALREAQHRLAYYERFGTVLEEQMTRVVAKAAEVAQESEQAKADMEREVGRLRQEAESLRAECERQRSEAATFVAQAHQDAAGVLARARGDVSRIVSGALAELEQAQREVLQSTIVPMQAVDVDTPRHGDNLNPPRAPHITWSPPLEAAQPPESSSVDAPRKDDPEASVERLVELPVEQLPAEDAAEGPTDDAVVTYLTVHSDRTPETLPQLGRALEGLPGVRGTAVARLNDAAVEMVVAHQRGTDLVASMRSIPDMDFRLVARGEGLLEIELLQRNAPPLRA